MGVAVVFPGQGAQYVGMVMDLAAEDPVVADTLAEADDALGMSLSHIIRDGPDERLAETAVTQPAILAASVAMWRRLRALHPGFTPVAAAGHSLGEYSALVAAGSLSFRDGLRLVAFRGQAMQQAVPRGQGRMVALLGLDDNQVHGLCAEAAASTGTGIVQPAAFNCPGQAVVSGDTAAIGRLVELAEAAGCRGWRDLNVSAPFHCALLEPARQAMAGALAQHEIRPAAFPIIQNADAEPHTDPAHITAGLVNQMVMPVLWQQSIRRMLADGVTRFVEVGPGRTLTGLIKKIARDVDVLTLDRTGAWQQLKIDEYVP